MVSLASSARRIAESKPVVRLPRIPWPEGTAWFAFRTWVALAIGYYTAFWLQLEEASSAGVCVLILAQPQQGMVLSKSLYRFAATVIGGALAVCLTALFPQDRVMLLVGFALIMAVQTAIGSVLRDFRSYACILAGYTVAIISVANIDNPSAVFSAAIERVAAIAVGVAAIAITNAFLATAESSQSLISKLRQGARDVVNLALETLETRRAPAAVATVRLSSKLMPLRSEISFAAPEKPRGRYRAKGARSALVGLFETISAIHAVGAGLEKLEKKSAWVETAIAEAKLAMATQHPERHLPKMEAIIVEAARSGDLTEPEAFVLDRLHFMLETLGHVRNGLVSLRIGIAPRRDVRVDVNQDWFAVVLNGVRMLIAIGVVASLSVLSGITDTATAVLFTAVFVSLGAVQPNPNVMGRAALFGMPAVVVTGAFYAFFVFPNIDGFPLFIISLAPLVAVMCWFVKIGMGGAGLIYGVQTIVLISPNNVQTLDPTTFVSTATMLTVSGLAIALSFVLVLPVNPAMRRLRLALAVGRSLRDALADRDRLNQPRASLFYDRLAQFNTWQGGDEPTLARRNEMQRLVDLQGLSLAVRRSWRSLDEAKPFVDAEADQQARRAVRKLARDDLFGLGERYLNVAKAQADRAALTLVRAAGALHGTALATTRETQLLARVGLTETRP